MWIIVYFWSTKQKRYLVTIQKFPSNHCYDCVPTEPMLGIDFMVPLRIQTRNSSLGKWATVPLRNTNRAQSFTMPRHFKHFELFNYQQWLQMIANIYARMSGSSVLVLNSIAFQWVLAICIMKHGIHVNLYFQLSPLWRKRMCSKDKMHPYHNEIKDYNPPYIFSYKYLQYKLPGDY